MHQFIAALRVATLASMVLAALPALAGPRELLAGYETAARQATPAFAGFSAARGATFFQDKHGNDWSCATCHTGKPTVAGAHAKTLKPIAPLAPTVNPDRFADAATTEKWFRRNCNDVTGRECTPQEKGDVLAWLLTLK